MESLNRADPVELGGIALRGRLGQGGMGVVYFGVTPDGEPVAVKTIRAEALSKPVARSRFEREILALLAPGLRSGREFLGDTGTQGSRRTRDRTDPLPARRANPGAG
jgi:hypothetical protein